MSGDDTRDDDDDEPYHGEDEVVVMEITRELDLHTFSPRDVKALVPDYLDECLERGFDEVRIVHGKGKGVLRTIVHAALDRHPAVADYKLAVETRGGWGATIVTLAPSKE